MNYPELVVWLYTKGVKYHYTFLENLKYPFVAIQVQLVFLVYNFTSGKVVNYSHDFTNGEQAWRSSNFLKVSQ